MLIFRTAIANDVFYPAYNVFSKSVGSLLGRTAMRRYEQLFHQCITSQAILQSEAKHLLETFEERGLQVMPLKGLLLSTQYYKNPLMRYSRDLDFLFKSKTEKSVAEQAIIGAGYAVSLINPNQTRFTKHISRFSVHCETHNTPISLTFSFPHPSWHDLWSSSRSGQLMGSSANLMLPEDAFLILCAHILTKGMLSLRDFMDFIVILRNLNPSSWIQLERLSNVPIWRYIIAVPLLLFSTIGEILLLRELVPRETIQSFATNTTIRIGDSRKLVTFLLREHGMPIDLRHVMRYYGYSKTPLFAAYLLWNGGRELTFLKRIKTHIFIEGCQSIALTRSELNQGCPKNYIRSYIATYMLHFNSTQLNYVYNLRHNHLAGVSFRSTGRFP
jgi:hypothetical protein